jgi:hypothetical protein
VKVGESGTEYEEENCYSEFIHLRIVVPVSGRIACVAEARSRVGTRTLAAALPDVKREENMLHVQLLRAIVTLLCVTTFFACAQKGRARNAGAAGNRVSDQPGACVDDWQFVAEGVEYRMLNCSRSSGRFDLHVVRVDTHRASVDAVVRPGASAAVIAHDGHHAVVINANFFDERLKPLGLVLSRGRVVNPLHRVSWQSIYLVDRNAAASIVLPEKWDAIRSGAGTAVQAGPRLVVGGVENHVADALPEPRAGVCVDSAGRTLLFATPGGSYFDVREMAALAARALNCRDAMLFDGGPSVQLFVRGFVSQPGDPRVPSYLVVH